MKKISKTISIFFIICIVLLIGFLFFSRIKQAKGLRKISHVKERLLFVNVSKVRKGIIKQYVYGEGTVRSTRKEFLTFDVPGRVVFINSDINGEQLREGSIVKGPREGERFGQLLAHLDKRGHNETLKIKEATLKEAEKHMERAKLGVSKAKDKLILVKRKYDRSKKLYKNDLISLSKFEDIKNEIENARNELKSSEIEESNARSHIQIAMAQLNQVKLNIERISIFAPFDGVIAYLNIRKGDFVSPDYLDRSNETNLLSTAPIVVISNESFETILGLPVYDGRLVMRGQKVYITWNAESLPLEHLVPEKILQILTDGDEAYHEYTASRKATDDGDDVQIDSKKVHFKNNLPFAIGTVYSVSPSVNPKSRIIQIKIRTSFGAECLMDGIFVKCSIVTKEKKDALLIPTNSLVYQKNSPYVYTVDANTRIAKKKKIELGIEDVNMVEALEGVSENELVITDGRQRIGDNEKVTILNAK
jgi:multidrug efflux pump subunit AcrA (membrane-fusion protein)